MHHLKRASIETGIYTSGLIILLLAILMPVSDSLAQVRLIHTPQVSVQENQPLEIVVRVEGQFTSADEMRVYYRTGGIDTYDYVVLENLGDEYRGDIPPFSFSDVKIDYFVSFIQGTQITTLPESNPFDRPYEVQITPGQAPAAVETPEDTVQVAAADEEKYLILSPEQGERLQADEVVVALTLFFDPGEIDVNATQVLVDGRVVDAELSENLVTYTPENITSGVHRVEVRLFDSSGDAVSSVKWNFQVIRPAVMTARATPLIPGASGNVYAESRLDKFSGDSRENHQIGGSIRGRKGAVRYGSKIYITSLEDENFQPRNRFSFFLHAGPVSLYAGDTNPRFSELMLWGRRVRGFEGQLNLKFINFDFVMGQVNRSVTPGPTSSGTFTRDLLGLRTSFGSGRSFQFGLNLLRVRDDTTSISGGIKPKDNVVGGADILFSLLNNKLRWKSEVAFSLLSDDIEGGALTKEEIEELLPDQNVDIDFSRYEDFFIINASTRPLDPGELSSLAYSTSLEFKLARHDLRFKYKRIGSAYNSLANTFLKSNVRGLLVSDRVRLWQNRLYLTLSYEDYEDNFNAEDDNPTIDLRTLRGGLSIFPGPGLPNVSFNYRTYSRDNGITEMGAVDQREDNTTSELSANMNYDLFLFDLDHTLSLSYITMDKTDEFEGTRSGLPIGINNDIQSISLRTKFRIPLTTSISYSNNDNSFLGGMNSFEFKTLDLRADYKLMQNRLSIYGGYRFFDASGSNTTAATPTDIDYTRNQLSFGGRFKISTRTFFVMDGSTIKFNDNGTHIEDGNVVPNDDFNDYSFRFRLETRF